MLKTDIPFAQRVKNVALVILGTAALAFGTAIFIIPFGIVAGGVSGLAIVLKELISHEAISVDMIISALCWILFLFGFLTLGGDFALKTLVSSIAYPPLVTLFKGLAAPDILGGYFFISDSTDVGLLAVAAAAGGALVGLGCALSFLGGGSTGGIDIIAVFINKLIPRFKSSKIIFFIDASIVIAGMLLSDNVILSLVGIFSALISALAIDKIFIGSSRAIVAEIISDEYEAINQMIIDKLGRTATITKAVGGYSKDEKRVLTVSLTVREYRELLSIVGLYDKRAFITVYNAHEICGEGWTR